MQRRISIVLASFAFTYLLVARVQAMAQELPDYKVVEAVAGGIEIREYPSLLLAEVAVAGAREAAANEAFRILAAFIFGANTSSAKVAMTAPVTQTPAPEAIAMTAPVTQAQTAEGAWVVAFTMPAQYSEATLPRPNDARITIRRSEPYRAAAIRFSNRWTRANLDRHKAALDAFLSAQGLVPVGPPVYAFYNGPFTPFFLRRNEVIYRL